MVDLDAIRARLRARYEAKGLAATGVWHKEHGIGQTTVRNFLDGMTQSLTIETVAKLEGPLDADARWIIFGDDGRPSVVTQQALERAISEALPGLPRATDRRAQYLAATVARILQLPEGLRDEPANDATPAVDDSDAASPPHSPTS